MLFYNTFLNAQVLTRVLGHNETMEMFLPFSTKYEGRIYQQREIDFDKVLREDKEKGKRTHRYAVDYQVNYGVEDGVWNENEEFSIWMIAFESKKASSMQVMFENLKLHKTAEMYIYSDESNIIQGPITSEVITNGVFTSDIIEKSRKIQIAIICEKQYKSISLNISRIAQGIANSGLRSSGWNAAGDCNFDVNCAIGSAWTLQSDATGLIAINMSQSCSGVLVNNECQDFTPNFLTAFHCLEDDVNINMANWVFRFNYQSGSPTCPENTVGTQPSSTTWITRTGATFRTSIAAVDIALLQLNGGRIGLNPIESNVALAGWDRSSTAPTFAFGIHHPSGDAKKISFSNGPTTITGLTNLPGTACWRINITGSGAFEGGSSGSPMFNQDGRIVGILNSGTANWCSADPRFGNFGRFNLAWDAGLSGDLTMAIVPTTTLNGIRLPSFSPAQSNPDYDLICNSNKTITLINPIPGHTVSWSVSNPALFASTGGASTSGTTVDAVIRAASNTVSGSSVLTFTLTNQDCQPVTFTRNLWVGVPTNPTTNPPNGYYQLNMGSSTSAYITNSNGATNFIGTWTKSGNVNIQYTSAYTNYITPTAPGNGYVYVKASNECGLSSQSVINYFIPSMLILYPTITNKEEKLKIKLDQDDVVAKYNLTIVNEIGNIVDLLSVETNNPEIDISKFKTGLYLFKFTDQNGFTTIKRLIVK
jgi:lysyl endopeptidase